MQPMAVFKAKVMVDGKPKVVPIEAWNQSHAKALLELSYGKGSIIDGPYPT